MVCHEVPSRNKSLPLKIRKNIVNRNNNTNTVFRGLILIVFAFKMVVYSIIQKIYTYRNNHFNSCEIVSITMLLIIVQVF